MQTLGRPDLPALRSELYNHIWDVIVVGAGHNGLTAAAYLAREGKSVLVLERRDVVGGACTIEEPWPGYRISPCAYVAGLLHPVVVSDLKLDARGITVQLVDPQLFVPLPDGRTFIEWSDPAATAAHLKDQFPGQVEGWRAYQAFWDRIRARIRPDDEHDLWLDPYANRGIVEDRLAGIDGAVGAMFSDSIVDLVGRFVEDRGIIDALAGQGVIGTNASPFDPGTAYVSFHHSSGRMNDSPGDWGFVRGGMGLVSFAICDAAIEEGAVVVTDATVWEIEPGSGVHLDNSFIRGRTIVSNADPATTARLVPSMFRLHQEAAAIPRSSPTVKVTYALAGIPDFGPGSETAMINVTQGALALHESQRKAAAGQLSEELWCELYLQTTYDPSIAPPDRHVLSAFCQYVPYQFRDGSWETRRREVGDRVDDSIERYAPGFKKLIVERRVEGPPDLEQRLGLVGGHIFHGEILPQHMWEKRTPYRWAEGLYMCGAGTHPGGSVIGVNGRNAALVLLEDL
jgi:phytoene dehydrogenase-like protein